MHDVRLSKGWIAFKTIDELFILVPILLNLKGNLEMNLSARLSTAANIGDLDNRRVRRTLIFGNLSLLQVQALLVSAVAAVLSFLLGIIMGPAAEPKDDPPAKSFTLRLLKMTTSRRRPKYHPPKSPIRAGVREFFLVLTSALFSASASSLVLGSFVCSLVILCRKLQLNPDNIAPPVASVLGDLVTLTLLGLISTAVYSISNGLLIVVLLALLATFLFCLVTTLHNPLVRPIIAQGWTPLFGAMAISAGAGLVLDKFVSRYDSFGLLSVVVGGLPGSVGSIYISRLSTTLHAIIHSYHEPRVPVAITRGDDSPRARSSSVVSHGSINEVATSDPRPFVTATALFLVTLPVLVVFLVISYAVGWLTLPVLFVLFFSFVFCTTVSTNHTMAQLDALTGKSVIGHIVSRVVALAHHFPLGSFARPGHIRITSPIVLRRLDWSGPPSDMLRNRSFPRRRRPCQTETVGLRISLSTKDRTCVLDRQGTIHSTNMNHFAYFMIIAIAHHLH